MWERCLTCKFTLGDSTFRAGGFSRRVNSYYDYFLHVMTKSSDRQLAMAEVIEGT